MKTNELISIAVEASIEAGKRIMEIYNFEDFDVDFKSDNSPLTKADIASHNIIMSFLEKTRIPVLSEEGKEMSYDERKDWNTLWIVDPIDGTKEFIKKNGEFTVNIALIENNKPILGVIYVPALNVLYYSSIENGAFKTESISDFNGMELIQSNSFALPKVDDTRPFTVVASRSHLSPETETYIADLKQEHGTVDLISKGSSLKLCMVAEGSADCYPRFAPTMEWDTAAGQAICMHAGFDVIDWETKESMLYNREQLLNNWFLVK
ncbi:MAG: 3'(2'),5'-bisphosphate nucleotidase CysQ [Crocinitomicaceae bacterium]|nr:3'(2'),5'-bisphosphate nucleotidase CysQ [Crocinitomicaceae bacterium]